MRSDRKEEDEEERKGDASVLRLQAELKEPHEVQKRRQTIGLLK